MGITTSYEILSGVTIPDHVFSSNKWRNLRQSLEKAEVGEQVVVHLKAVDFSDDGDMVKAVNRVRSSGCSGYSMAAGLTEKGLFVRTNVVKVNDLPEDVKAPLNEQGIDPNDTIVVCQKTRRSNKPRLAM